MKRLLSLYVVLLPVFAFVTATVFAAGTDTGGCQPIYGGGETCPPSTTLSIDKQVKNPDTGDYVNSLGVTDSRYMPGDAVPFKITIKNTSSQDISNITVKDIFPQFVDFLSGSGTFDNNTKTLTFTIDKLNAGDSNVFFLQGKVVDKSSLPQNQGVVCVINQATATSGGASTQNNSMFCIQKEEISATLQPTGIPAGMPGQSTTKGGKQVFQPTQTKKTPPTGPEDWAVFGMIPTGVLGYWLRRKTK